MWQTIIGAAVALAGVLAADWLARNRERRLRIQSNVLELANATPIFTAYYSADPNSPQPDSDYFGSYWTLREQVFRKLGELRYLPRWPMKNAKAIRQEAESMMVYLIAVEFRAQRGIFLSRREQASIHMKHNLHQLVFGLDTPDQDLLRKLDEEGFDELVQEMWGDWDAEHTA